MNVLKTISKLILIQRCLTGMATFLIPHQAGLVAVLGPLQAG